MPRTKAGSLPSYRLYKRTGQAVVTLDGHDHYLGPYGSPESRKAYNRLIEAWLARQEQMPAGSRRPACRAARRPAGRVRLPARRGRSRPGGE
jgi:hypothetical protein